MVTFFSAQVVRCDSEISGVFSVCVCSCLPFSECFFFLVCVKSRNERFGVVGEVTIFHPRVHVSTSEFCCFRFDLNV